MRFKPIDTARWERREIFELFNDTCMYVTSELDVSGFLGVIKRRGLRFYPSLIYCISHVVNHCQDYRHGYDEARNVGVWDVVHPLYTVPRREKPHLFSMVSTEYDDDFAAFYGRFLDDYRRAATCGRLMCDESARPCHIGITAMPDLNFTSFSFGGTEGKNDLTPFAVIGRYCTQDERILLPLCMEFAHAVNDGYHVGRFFKLLGAKLDQFTSSFD